MHVHQRTAAFIAAFAAATVLAGTMVAASAEPTPAPPQAHGIAPTSGAQYAVANDVLIQGVVGDKSRAFRPIDDVTVQAVAADGTVAATGLTYASQRPKGAQHGYFYLRVPAGDYRLDLSKNGYTTQTIPVTADPRKATSLGVVGILPSVSKVRIIGGGEGFVTSGERLGTSFQVIANFGKVRGTGRIIDQYKTKTGKTRTRVLKKIKLTGANGRIYTDKVRVEGVGKHKVYLDFRGAPGVGDAQSQPYIVWVKAPR